MYITRKSQHKGSRYERTHIADAQKQMNISGTEYPLPHLFD